MSAAISIPGFREEHYRGTSLGVTLAHPLALHLETRVESEKGPQWTTLRPGLVERGTTELKDRNALLSCIRNFREAVEAVVPGAYAWFDEGSLHLTLRAVIA